MKLHRVETPDGQVTLQLYVFLTSALNLASAHIPVDQPLLFRFVTALLWLLAVAREWPVSDFIHASCWPALLDFKTEQNSTTKIGCIASGGHPIPMLFPTGPR